MNNKSQCSEDGGGKKKLSGAQNLKRKKMQEVEDAKLCAQASKFFKAAPAPASNVNDLVNIIPENELVRKLKLLLLLLWLLLRCLFVSYIKMSCSTLFI